MADRAPLAVAQGAVASATALLVATQFFLAGAGAFGATSFDAHKTVGSILVLVALLVLLAAALARRFAATAQDRLRLHADPVLAAADAYSYLHLVIVAGIIVFAVGVKQAAGAVDAPLADAARLALCGGVALYLAGHVAFGLRMVGAVGVEKLVAAAAVLVLYAVGGHLDAWLLAGAVAAVLGAMCTVETILARRAEPRRPAG